MGAALTAYYNENNPDAAEWLRDLIRGGHIPPGDVDERSIEDVHPNDLRDYIQCHFFAGIGIWPYALRLAGWADDRPVWSGSCPCQPFSAAGKGAGFDDERHLWPHWHHLIRECRPAVVFGEQVASKDADPWIDLVHADMEALGSAFGCVPFPSAGIGAPHIRDRSYWVADADIRAGRKGRAHLRGRTHGSHAKSRARPSGSIVLGGLADAHNARLEGRHGVPERADQCSAGADGLVGGMADNHQHGCASSTIDQCDDAEYHSEPRCESRWLANANSVGAHCEPRDHGEASTLPQGERKSEDRSHVSQRSSRDHDGQRDVPGNGVSGDSESAGPTNSIWSAADWLLCRDGKWRPVEPGTFPLVDGAAASMGRSGTDWRAPAGQGGFGHRAGRLKGYGNAINAEAARVFIECYLEGRP